MRLNRKYLLILALILLASGVRGLAAQEPDLVPVDEEPATEAEADEELLFDEGSPLDQELPEESPVFDEMPMEQSPPEELEVPVIDPPAPSPPPKPKAPAAPRVSSFKVRAALAGSGFRGGASGTLRISASGVSFTRQGQTAEDWRIQWADLAAARSADGIWDAPHPLVIQERGGRKHYLALIDPRGRYLPGQEVLAAITKRQRKGD